MMVIVMKLTHEEKLRLMKNISWDVRDSAEDILGVLEGRRENSGSFDRERLFVRSLEYLPWHYNVALWGVDAMKRLYSPETRGRIWPPERRKTFDFAFGILRGEPVSFAGWGTEYVEQMRRAFLSDRWNRPEQGVLSPPILG
jgi:hypothetical protein